MGRQARNAGWKKRQKMQWRLTVRELVQKEISARGCCQWPECNKSSTDWHHLVPSEKSFSIGGKAEKVSKGALLAEMAKCVRVCRGHHFMAEAYLEFGWEYPDWRVNDKRT